MKKKPDAIPLEALLDAPGFERNCEILLSESVDAPSAADSSRARKAITSLVISGAVERAQSKRQHVANSQKGGAASVQSRRSELALRNKTIAEDARRKLAAGYSEREICGILAQQKGLSDKTIREILREQGVLKKRK